MNSPAAFLRIGVGDSDLQVIGEEHTRAGENSCLTMWNHYARHSGLCFNDETPDRGIDRYNRWKEDAELLAFLSLRLYRTSISMARVLTEDGKPNLSAIKWYRKYFSQLRSHGITVCATLYHWELPYYAFKMGGWKNRAVVDLFLRHVAVVIEHLADLVDEFFVLNEPWCSAHNSYHAGVHAPGERDLRSALVAAHHLLLAQGRAVRLLRKSLREHRIGTVVNVEPAYAASNSRQDQVAARFADEYMNQWFLEPLFEGRYPERLQRLFGDKMPPFYAEDLEEIRVGGELDMLGLNYYLGKTVRFNEYSDVNFTTIRKLGEQTSSLGWPIYTPPIYPPGLQDVLHQVYTRYSSSGLRELYVTENGIALGGPDFPDELDDQPRIEFLRQHIRQAERARQEGVPLTGFFVWTLIDNYEWAEGYRPQSRFGMIAVDRVSLERRPKKSAFWLKELLEKRRRLQQIPADIRL